MIRKRECDIEGGDDDEGVHIFMSERAAAVSRPRGPMNYTAPRLVGGVVEGIEVGVSR